MIWLIMLVPIAMVGVLLWKFRKETAWWELLVLLGLPPLLIVGAQAIVERITVSDTEYWGGVVVKAEYYEDWDEKVSCRHPVYCETCSGSGKDRTCTKYQCGTDHFYDVDYHGPEWQVVDSNGQEWHIGQSFFEQLAQRWQGRQFVELNRSYHSNDGDKYVSVWDNKMESSEPTSSEHSYENRVAVSDSIFNYPEVSAQTKKEFSLYDYPPIQGYRQQALLGVNDRTVDHRLQYLNGMLGRSKQVKVFVLVWQDQPMQASFEQEALWKNGNKNEFVVCIGVDSSQKVQWARVFSWTEVEALKSATASFIMGQEQLNLGELATWLHTHIKSEWSRKQFADFAYLSVQPPTWATILVCLLTCMLTGGVAVWIIGNEHGGENVKSEHNPFGSGGEYSPRSDYRRRRVSKF